MSNPTETEAFWTGIGLQAKQIEWLPYFCPMSKTGSSNEDEDSTIKFDYMKISELEETYKFVSSLVQHPELNIGIDEFPTKADFQELLRLSKVFIGRIQGSIDACIVIQPCQFSRTEAPCLAALYIFVSIPVFKYTFSAVAGLAEMLVKGLDLGYTIVVTQVFMFCSEFIQKYKQLGYIITACLPHQGYIVRHKQISQSLIMVKYLPGANEKVHTAYEIRAYCKRQAETYPSPVIFKPPIAPFLPALVTLDSGASILVRNIKEEDCRWIFEEVRSLACEGKGYGMNEFPAYDFYKRIFLHTHHTFILEDAKMHDIIAVVQGAPTYVTRQVKSSLSDCDILVMPKYNGKGYSEIAVQICFALLKDAGFTGILTDSLTDNPAIYGTQRKLMKFVYPGSLPNADYKPGIGWIDTLFAYFDLGWIRAFTERDDVTLSNSCI